MTHWGIWVSWPGTHIEPEWLAINGAIFWTTSREVAKAQAAISDVPDPGEPRRRLDVVDFPLD